MESSLQVTGSSNPFMQHLTDYFKRELELSCVPEKVIVQGTHTVILWSDDSRTVVNLMEGDTFNLEFAVAMGIVKKFFPNHNAFKKLVEDAYVQPVKEIKPKKENKDAL